MIFLDLILLVNMLLPDALRRTDILAFYRPIIEALDSIKNNNQAVFDAAKYRLQFNELKIYLEHYLNDRHDSINRGIYIEDVEQDENLYVFNSSENNEPLYLWNSDDPDAEPVYLYNQNEIENLTDFVVYVPFGLTYNVHQLTADVNHFKLPGMKFQILTYP
jgi:hypothetical protein